MNIVVENLTKKYGDKAVFDNFNITFPENKVSVIMGKSGAGKTTLLNCLANLTDYDGKIYGAEKVAYIFQDARLAKYMTVYENLDFTLGGAIGKDERRERIRNVLSEVSLLDKSGALPDELSGGQKKRVSVARAFLSDAPALLSDEPLNSLDVGLRIRTVSLLLTMLSGNPKTVVYVTHDADEALSVADEIVVIGENKIEYSYSFSSAALQRDVFSEECSRVKKKLIELLV